MSVATVWFLCCLLFRKTLLMLPVYYAKPDTEYDLKPDDVHFSRILWYHNFLLLMGVFPYLIFIHLSTVVLTKRLLVDFLLIALLYIAYHFYLKRQLSANTKPFLFPAVIFMSRWLAICFRLEESCFNFILRKKTTGHLQRILKENIMQFKMCHAAESSEIKDDTPNEISIIRNSERLFSKSVQEIMTPWAKVVTLNHRAVVDDAFRLLSSSGFSRFPVVDDSGRPMGIYKAHLLELLFAKNLPVVAKMSDELVVQGIDNCFLVLQKLRQYKRHIAHVYTADTVIGVISMEDILEEMVGEIEDEFDLI